MESLAAAFSLCLFVPAAFAQSPYAGMQSRPIKALSEQQIADLKAGAAWAGAARRTQWLSGAGTRP